MNNVFTINIRALKRIVYTMIAALLVVAGLPFFQSGKASANQFANRAIQMSDSAPSGGTITTGVGSGDNVTYRVSVDAVHAGQSIVIDFCSSTPILGDSCTAPTGMDASAATLAAVTGKVGTGDWMVDATTANQIQLKTSTPADAIVASSSEVFDLEGITNPSTNGTFFARIYTFPDDAYGSYVSPASPGLSATSDFGGIALSTAAVITITARVQESITFCITNANPTTWADTANSGANPDSCSAAEVAANPPAVTIGHTVGGPTLVLDSGVVDKGDTPIWTQLSTNATHGANINLRSNWACGGLSADGGTTCAIPPVGDTATVMTAGTAAFGVFVSASYPNANTPGATGTITPELIYNDGVNTNEADLTALAFGMDNTTTTAKISGLSAYNGSVSGTFGSTVAKSTGPTYRIQNRYIFGATAALTTPAGIYTSNMTMTATGTF